jgi:hypothetical protein
MRLGGAWLPHRAKVPGDRRSEKHGVIAIPTMQDCMIQPCKCQALRLHQVDYDPNAPPTLLERMLRVGGYCLPARWRCAESIHPTDFLLCGHTLQIRINRRGRGVCCLLGTRPEQGSSEQEDAFHVGNYLPVEMIPHRAIFTHGGSAIVSSAPKEIDQKVQGLAKERDVDVQIAHDGMETTLR